MENEVIMSVKAKSQNEAFVRVAAAAFFAQLDPALSDIADIKTAVSEAVTNAIIHGYPDNPEQIVTVVLRISGKTAHIEVTDSGVGIEDIAKAREPFYTSKQELERSGMGFSVMESFMDSLEVKSEPGKGTTVIMEKTLSDPVTSAL